MMLQASSDKLRHWKMDGSRIQMTVIAMTMTNNARVAYGSATRETCGDWTPSQKHLGMLWNCHGDDKLLVIVGHTSM